MRSLDMRLPRSSPLFYPALCCAASTTFVRYVAALGEAVAEGGGCDASCGGRSNGACVMSFKKNMKDTIVSDLFISFLRV